MGNSRLIFFAAAVGLGLCAAATLGGTYSGGNGTPEDPYRIDSAGDWAELMLRPGDWNNSFVLTRDLDLAGMTMTPVGDDTTPFTGMFDGQGLTITNVIIDLPQNEYVGLFGCTDAGVRIENLGVSNVYVHGRVYVGGLIGYINAGAVTSCHVGGVVEGYSFVGGLIGYAAQTATSLCCSTADIIGGVYVGGLIGGNDSDIPTPRSAMGAQTELEDADPATITSCCTTGSVTATGSKVGGLVGDNSGIIGSCYATSSVEAAGESVGGLVGVNLGTVMRCYATGRVTGTGPRIGGLVGFNSRLVTACVWDAQTSGRSGSSGGKGLSTEMMKTLSVYSNAGWADAGWVIIDGQDYPRLNWQATGGSPIALPEPVSLAGVGTAEDPYLVETGKDFAELSWHSSLLDKHIKLTSALDLEKVDIRPIGDLGPFTGVFDGNDLSIRNVRIIDPNNDFMGVFAMLGPGGEVVNLQIVDANITGRERVGSLVGENEQGTVLRCSASGTVMGSLFVGGLVGLSDAGKVDSCYAACSTTAETHYAGGLVGFHSYGTITSCRATGVVNGVRYVGGLAGSNSSAAIGSSHATGSVSGHRDVGGLVGYNHGEITSCGATGPVEGIDRCIGGLVGTNLYGTIGYSCSAGRVSAGSAYDAGGLVGRTSDGAVMSCYSTGDVNGDMYIGGLAGSNWDSAIVDCFSTGRVEGSAPAGGFCGHIYVAGDYEDTGNFWDVETSGMTSSSMGSGPTTGQMQMLSTFVDAGWDFVDTWAICEGTGYPRLQWQIPAADFACPDGVAWEDLQFVASRWLLDECGSADGCNGADLTGDGAVDFDDFSALGLSWFER